MISIHPVPLPVRLHIMPDSRFIVCISGTNMGHMSNSNFDKSL